jgi:dTDP-4-dehydrorhamnose 3,5-epimerase
VQVLETTIPGVLIVEPRVFADARGFLLENWNAKRYAAAGIAEEFVQDNLSFSNAGVLRGLHLQHPHDQAKLVSVVSGEVYDVAVDVRRDSPTFGQWVGETLSAENHRQLMIPGGFAHGFVVTGTHALVSYKTTDYYDPASEQTIRWDDPALAIAWPIRAPILSERDNAALPLAAIAMNRLPSR